MRRLRHGSDGGATWDRAAIHFERRQKAAQDCDDAVAALAAALDRFHHETALVRVLFEGRADSQLVLSGFRGTLGVMLTEATTGQKVHIDKKPLAELARDQHDLVRRDTKL